MTKVDSTTWKYTFPSDPSGLNGFLFCDGVNNSGNQSADYTSVPVNGHIYTCTSKKGAVTDLGAYSSGSTTDPTPDPTPSGSMWILGNLGDYGWGDTPGTGVAMTQNGTTYTATGVTFVLPSSASTTCYFNLTDYVGATWDDLNAGANRYGAATEGEAITVGKASTVVLYANNVSASGCQSWTVAPGTYDVVFDSSAMTITLTKTSGVEGIEADNDVEAVYYNLQGVKVENPAAGLYIVVRGNQITKEIVK
jgi:hypothetical protein